VTPLLPFHDGNRRGFRATKRAAGITSRPYFVQYVSRSGSRRDFLAIVFGPRLAGAAARLGSIFFLSLDITRADRWRQDAERDALFAYALVVVAFLSPGAIGATFTIETVATIRSLEPVAASIPIAASRTLADVFAIIFGRIAIGNQLFVTLDFFLVIAARPTLGLLLLEARAIIFEHSEIMVGVLKIIFGLHPVAGELRIARQTLVLLQKLGGIAALTVVLAISASISGHTLRTLSAAATTTAALTIVDQILVPCRTGAGLNRSP
jgi:hypothetical protein